MKKKHADRYSSSRR